MNLALLHKPAAAGAAEGSGEPEDPLADVLLEVDGCALRQRCWDRSPIIERAPEDGGCRRRGEQRVRFHRVEEND